MSAHLTPVRPAASALATPLPRVLRPNRAVPSDAVRPTRAEINLANLRHNLRVVERTTGGPVWSVLKADGYGHGAKAVARTLERAGTAGICVALVEEGIELRDAGIRSPVLVMGGHYGAAYGEVLHHDLTPVVHDAGQVEALAEEVRFSKADPVRVHVKIDTGMHRLGAPPRDVARLGRALVQHPEVIFDGLMTHFACADSGDSESIGHQLALFDDAERGLKSMGLVPNIRHAANSAALFQSSASHLDFVRPGIALFGVEPRGDVAPDLRPAMSITTEITAIREVLAGQSVGYGATWTAGRTSLIATIPAGYADGLARGLSNRGAVLVRGKRAPIVGTVSMDMTMIDVTEIAEVAVGDACVALGRQRGPLGEATITASEIAHHLGTIPWEVLTNVSRRVPRFYREP